MAFKTDEITCPYCSHEFSDSWCYGEGEDLGEIACGECGRAFYAHRVIAVSYSTETLEARRRLS